MAVELIGQVADREKRALDIVILDFETKYLPDPRNGEKNRKVDYVRWAKRGQIGSETVQRISEIMPRNGRTTVEWDYIGPIYERWLEDEKIAEDGIPLETWAGAPKHLVEALKPMHVRTVEDFADMNDSVGEKLMVPDWRKRRAAAQNYLKGENNAALVAENNALKERLESQEADMKEMRQQMSELVAKQRENDKQSAGPPPMTPPAPAPEVPKDDTDLDDAIGRAVDSRPETDFA